MHESFLLDAKLFRSLTFIGTRKSLIHKKMQIFSQFSPKKSFYSMKALLLTIILTLTLLERSSSTVTYAPGPKVNQTYVMAFDTSSYSIPSYIGSKRPEVLIIGKSGTTSMMIAVEYFNRSSTSGLMTKYTLYGQAGNWSYIKSTKNTLSCNMLADTTSLSIGFYRFNSDQKQFYLYAKVPLQTIKNALPIEFSSMTDSLLMPLLSPAESCDTFSIGNAVYYINNVSMTVSSRTIPTGWNLDFYTESFKYGITDSKLYRFNSNTNLYEVIYTFDKYVKWSIKESYGKIVASGSNATAINATASTFIQMIYILLDSATTPTLIKAIPVTGTSNYQDIIPIYTSQKMSKIGYFVIPTGSNDPLRITLKSIDFTNKQVIDLIVEEPDKLGYILTGIQPEEFIIGDYALVATNMSKGGPAFQEAYQYVGNKVVFIDRRTAEVGGLDVWLSLFIDSNFPFTIVSLNIYDTGGIQVQQTRFGNYADRRRIIPPASTYYIQLTRFGGYTYNDPTRLMWGSQYQGQTNTDIAITAHSPSDPNHYETTTSSLVGNYTRLARAPLCRIYFMVSPPVYYFGLFNSSAPTPFVMTSLNSILTPILASLNPQNDNWLLSDDCKRFSVKGSTYSLINGNFIASTENIANFIWSAADSLLNYVIFSNSIYKYNSATNAYVQYLNKTLYTERRKIYSYNNFVIVTATNTSSYIDGGVNYIDQQVFAYVDNGTALTEVFSYDVVWGSLPKIEISDKLGKIVIFGLKGTKTAVNAYSIDYTKKTNTTLPFPMEGVQEDPDFTVIKISEKYLYVRQIYDLMAANNDPNYYGMINRSEFVYIINGNVPKLMFKRELNNLLANQYQKALLLTDDNGASYYLAIQTIEDVVATNSFVVRKTILDPKLADLGNQIGYANDNGQIILCSPGCSECSNQICTKCVSGFAFKSTSAQCLPCGPNCITCDQNDPLICISCLNGTYLYQKRCKPCNSTCLHCTLSTNCVTCIPGYFFDTINGNCSPCQRNCAKCSIGGSTCLECNKGFILTNLGTCRGCSISCSDCKADDITSCTACAKGLQLVNSTCVSCPKNCIECTNGLCTQCAPGFSVDPLEGDCYQNCQPPCASCEEGKPTVCKSCFSSAVLTNGKCVFSDTCNNTGGCTNCGSGLGLYLRDQYCLNCSDLGGIPNCLQCSQVNQQFCSMCKAGYYIDSSGSCSQCPDNCTTCLSNFTCTSCAQGSTLRIDQSQGKCMTCLSPCLTCYGYPFHCLTCITGFTKEGWKCLNDTHIDLNLTLTGTVSNVLSTIDAVVTSILSLIGENTTNVDCVTITNIQAGSVVITAVTSPISLPVDTASNNLQTALTGGATIGGMTVTSSTVAVDSGSSGSSSSSSAYSQDINIPLIIGVSVGAFVLVVLIIAIIVFCLKKNHSKTVGNSDATKKAERQTTVVQEIEQSKTGIQPTNSNSKIKLRP